MPVIFLFFYPSFVKNFQVFQAMSRLLMLAFLLAVPAKTVSFRCVGNMY